MIKTNTNNINTICGIKKDGDYLVFLSGGGEEIARVETSSPSESSPALKLDLSKSGRLNLKQDDAIISYVNLLSPSEISILKKMIDGYKKEN
jgi:hypothetical protein